jgi:hypothetical protein
LREACSRGPEPAFVERDTGRPLDTLRAVRVEHDARNAVFEQRSGRRQAALFRANAQMRAITAREKRHAPALGIRSLQIVANRAKQGIERANEQRAIVDVHDLLAACLEKAQQHPPRLLAKCQPGASAIAKLGWARIALHIGRRVVFAMRASCQQTPERALDERPLGQ